MVYSSDPYVLVLLHIPMVFTFIVVELILIRRLLSEMELHIETYFQYHFNNSITGNYGNMKLYFILRQAETNDGYLFHNLEYKMLILAV